MSQQGSWPTKKQLMDAMLSFGITPSAQSRRMLENIRAAQTRINPATLSAVTVGRLAAKYGAMFTGKTTDPGLVAHMLTTVPPGH